MLRSVFIGSCNPFNRTLVNWLSANSCLTGVVWTNSTKWQSDFKKLRTFAMRRFRKRGVLKTLDEGLYCLIYRKILAPGAERALLERLVEPNAKLWPASTAPEIIVDDVNSDTAIAFIKACQSDLVLSMCVNEYFGKKLRAIPKLGCFLWHEGITPEYRGLYSPFWTILNQDLARLGYTFLKMNDKYDDGDVYVQGVTEGIDPLRDFPGFIGHKGIFDSLPAVGVFLDRLEAGKAEPILTSGRVEGTYTYPGITDYIRYRYILRLLKRAQTMPQSVLKSDSL